MKTLALTKIFALTVLAVHCGAAVSDGLCRFADDCSNSVVTDVSIGFGSWVALACCCYMIFSALTSSRRDWTFWQTFIGCWLIILISSIWHPLGIVAGIYGVLLFRNSANDRLPANLKRPAPVASRQAHFAAAANGTKLSVAPTTQHLNAAEEAPTPSRIPDTDPAPSEACWSAALTEFESAGRRSGLWAKAFSEAGGNEAIAKATYLRSRAVELAREEQSRIAALRHQAAEAEERVLEAERVKAELAYAALAKGICPNQSCRAIIPLNSQACAKCGAIFEEGAVWKVRPWRQP